MRRATIFVEHDKVVRIQADCEACGEQHAWPIDASDFWNSTFRLICLNDATQTAIEWRRGSFV